MQTLTGAGRRCRLLGAILLAFVSYVFLPQTFGEEAPAAPAPLTAAPKLVLKKGQRVAVVGDSITEQKLYSKYIELYLTACVPELDLHVIQLGWGGETAQGFLNRMNNDLMPCKPDVVTTCYGMNDGGYGSFSDAVGNRYRKPMTEIVKRLKDAGATVVVGSPGVVDTKYFGKGNAEAAKVYNVTLGKLRDIARELADQAGMPFANVHDAMLVAMERGKAELGENYDVGGKDGVHPGPNGHLVMAYAFLKGMGLDGDVGTLTVDLKGQTTASPGHKVLSAEGGKIEVESSRYPFCFFGAEKSSGGTRSILPYVPFNRDLNRFTLVVKNLDAPKATVTWGAASKSFTKEELEKGVNLADQFIENPFSEPFKKLDALIGNKESFETTMIKTYINQFPNMLNVLDRDADVQPVIEMLRKKFFEKYEKLHAAVREAVVPVKHTLTIAPEK